MEWETILRPAKQILCILGLNLNFGSSWNGLESKWGIANFLSSILPTQEWYQGVLGHFGKIVSAIQPIYEIILKIPLVTRWKVAISILIKHYFCNCQLLEFALVLSAHTTPINQKQCA